MQFRDIGDSNLTIRTTQTHDVGQEPSCGLHFYLPWVPVQLPGSATEIDIAVSFEDPNALSISKWMLPSEFPGVFKLVQALGSQQDSACSQRGPETMLLGHLL